MNNRAITHAQTTAILDELAWGMGRALARSDIDLSDETAAFEHLSGSGYGNWTVRILGAEAIRDARFQRQIETERSEVGAE